MMKLFETIKHRYDNLKIQVKITLCILIAVVIPILTLVIFFTGQLYDMVIADTIRKEQAATAEAAPLVEKALTEIKEVHERITGTEYYRQLFYRPINTSLARLAETEDALAFAETVQYLTKSSAVSAVRFYLDISSTDDIFTAKTSQNLFLPIGSAKGTYWYGIFQGSRISSLYCPAFYLGNYELEHYGDGAYITETSIYYQGENHPCYAAVYYSSEPLQKILSDKVNFQGSVSYLLNDREAVIASTDDYLASIYRLGYGDIEDSLLSSNNFIERDILGEKVYVGFHYIKEPKWFMVTVLPREPLLEKGNVMIFRIFVIYSLCILAAVAIAIWQSRSITSRISSVIRQMTQIRKGIPVQMPAPEIHDEVGELINTYNYMTDKMNQLMETQQKTAEELRIAEFNFLQAQINPHFLYNTMDMINWMALQGQTSEVSNVIQSLARFYKLTLSRKKNLSTIANEIEHVSIYVQLQNMRFQNIIDFVVDIPDEMLEYGIPKLTLQPIVENSILHGILEKEDKSGTIVITGWVEEENLIMLVSDDGIGIPPERLELLLSDTPIKNSRGANIAVSNIHRRLKLLYGPDYGLQYSSITGQGTEVKICLPKRSAEEDN